MKARALDKNGKRARTRTIAWLRSSITWLPGLLLSVLAIVILLRVVSWKEVLSAWASASPWVIIPALVLLVLAQLARAIAWRYLVDRKLGLSRSFSVLNVGYLLNTLLPLRLGDLGRAVLAGLPKGGVSPLSASSALSAVVVERVVDLLVTGLLGLAAIALFAGASWVSRALEVTLALAVLGTLALFALAVTRAAIVKAARRGLGRVAWLEPWVVRLDEFLEGIQVIGQWGVAVPALAGILAAWLAWILEYWVILQGFVPGASSRLALAALAGGALGVMLPSSPNAIGVYEAAVVGVLSVAGMSPGRALAFALSIHFLNTIGVIVLGTWGLLQEGQSLGQLVTAVMEIRGRKQPGEVSGMQAPPDRTGEG
ncbi:MAG: lysylphosphatidylglycerol synthase transmembrane domain-containing protein [Anaerolineales bacterium]